ncbi:MAG TPA: VOC family protein [Cyclobacteriaceae bacterium]|nr:VOC family protein [Cyclobacteriaceae bacterium]
MKFTGVDHPAVAAEDVEKLSEWYCTTFGYKKYFRHDKPVWMLLAPDNSLLEVMPRDNTSRVTRTTWTPGWSHLALRVENLDDAVRDLDKVGVKWEGEIVEAIGGGRVRSLYDPEGNMLQILERVFK